MITSMKGLARPLAVCLLSVLLAVVGVVFSQAMGSAQAAGSLVGPGESIQKATTPRIRETPSLFGEFTERTW